MQASFSERPHCPNCLQATAGTVPKPRHPTAWVKTTRVSLGDILQPAGCCMVMRSCNLAAIDKETQKDGWEGQFMGVYERCSGADGVVQTTTFA